MTMSPGDRKLFRMSLRIAAARAGAFDSGGLGTSNGLIPLTPALSRRERESRRQSFRSSEGPGVVAARQMVLPLPTGEGRGEGDQHVRSTEPSGIEGPEFLFLAAEWSGAQRSQEAVRSGRRAFGWPIRWTG